MAYRFSQRSLEKIEECHPDIKLILHESIRISHVDFGISCGHRSVEDQKKAFLDGKSKLDGIKKKSKHNYFPSLAFDIYVYVPGKKELTFDNAHLSYLAGVIMTTANRLYSEGLTKHNLRWGGNWNSDGQILYDQSFDDLPHFELI